MNGPIDPIRRSGPARRALPAPREERSSWDGDEDVTSSCEDEHRASAASPRGFAAFAAHVMGQPARSAACAVGRKCSTTPIDLSRDGIFRPSRPPSQGRPAQEDQDLALQTRPSRPPGRDPRLQRRDALARVARSAAVARRARDARRRGLGQRNAQKLGEGGDTSGIDSSRWSLKARASSSASSCRPAAASTVRVRPRSASRASYQDCVEEQPRPRRWRQSCLVIGNRRRAAGASSTSPVLILT
jgi:hypothetical protein